jgi:hypothetical protein
MSHQNTNSLEKSQKRQKRGSSFKEEDVKVLDWQGRYITLYEM